MYTIEKAWYAEDESGPAEILGERLARILSLPLFNDELFLGDIVRLDRDPRGNNGWPRIVEIVHPNYPLYTRLSFGNKDDYYLLWSILSCLGVESKDLSLVKGDSSGCMMVRHDEDIDPIALANAIGIPQEDDGEEQYESFHFN